MARWTTLVPTFTPTATADTTNLADNTHHTIQGGSTTQYAEMEEIQVSGQAGASAPTFLVFGRNSQVGSGTLTAARLAAHHPSTAALAAPPLPYVAAATNKPQRSSTLGMLLNCGINAFGGIMNWKRSPGENIGYLGNTASLGELTLSAFTGGTVGAISSGLVFDTL